MYDVAIIGAGPAGATLARLIGGRYNVLLIEKRRLPDRSENFSSIKCCGGLLAPDAQIMLSKLGLGLPSSVLEDPQLFVVKSIDMPQRLERYYQRHYINMNRKKFDSWLLSLVPANVAIQEWVERKNDFPYFTSIFDRSITDYYCWTIPKGNYLLIGAALPYKEKAAEKFALLKATLSRYGMQFGKTVFREGTLLLRPVKQNQLFTGRQGIALLGEAAGWISPSSAEGFSYAFKSALMLSDALWSSPDGFENRYLEKTAQLRKNIFLKNLKSFVIFNPLLRKWIMNTGLQSIRVRK